MELPELLDENQTSRLLRLPAATLRDWRMDRRGRGIVLPFYKVGRSVRYRRQDLLDFLDSRRQEATPPAARRAPSAGRTA
jgi:hypothetical protein